MSTRINDKMMNEQNLRVVDLVDYISRGADVNHCTHNGMSPAHVTSALGDVDSLRLLIRAGANINLCTTSSYRTPILFAARNGRSECVKLLVEAGADVNVVDRFGMTPIFVAIANRYIECIEQLIIAGSNINWREYYTLILLKIDSRYMNLVHKTLPEVRFISGADVHSDMECVICMEKVCGENEIFITDCNHSFHKLCLSHWLSTNNSCPLCRTKMY